MLAEGFPVTPVIDGDKITVSIKQLSADVFKYAFFDEGVPRNTMQLLHEYVDIDYLELPAKKSNVDVLIFHISHCGSSLLSQLFKIKDNFRVIGEPEVINTILLQQALTKSTNELLCEERLHKVTHLLLNAQRSQPGLNAIKLSSWNIFYASLFRTAFPHSQYIYVHRHPLEVLSSLLRNLNGFASWHLHTEPVLAAHFLSCSRNEVKQMSEPDYLARMLCKHMQHALHHLPDETLFLYYPDWVNSFPSNISSITTFSKEEEKQIKQYMNKNAKVPHQQFKFTQPVEVAHLLQSEVLNELIQLHEKIMHEKALQ
ncbi:MAG: sulfotransferase [Bacteroidia bacterium]|nr:sulfotransferase [Bacteroidia bacterium]MBP9180129.1 sulfotransferase [Bacteroidia bacterium]MBP9725296.1 sulfotransferase [Bacteroidia bacterium]